MDPADGERHVTERERIFNGAYETLDAAVMDRLLDTGYMVSYQGKEPERGREQFIGELGQLRLVFPKLRIAIDSTQIIPYDDLYIVQGIRTFHWETGEGPGTYRERFTNRWRDAGGEWRLFRTSLQPLP